MRPRALARVRAVVPQQTVLRFSFRVEEVVRMGRAPVRNPARDDAVVADALERLDLVELADRSYPSLSGGEQARVALARAIVQETPVLLLDEPTAALDLAHQQSVMALAAQLAAEGRTVIAVLHDLNLAAQHAQRVLLLRAGRVEACAGPWESLTAERVSRVFSCPVTVSRRPDADRPLVVAGSAPVTATERSGRAGGCRGPGGAAPRPAARSGRGSAP
jgi:iron complex transport system ATP-binding protein